MYKIAKIGFKNISTTMTHNEFDFIEDLVIPIQVNFIRFKSFFLKYNINIVNENN